MSITTGQKQNVIVHCFVCDQKDVVAKFQEMGVWPRPDKPWSPPAIPPEYLNGNGHADDDEIEWPEVKRVTPINKEIATYTYRDAHGNPVFEKLRYEPKTFKIRDATGRWGLNGAEPVLYRLPELLQAPGDALVFIVEGEKDADRLASLGLIATTNYDGADGKWLASYGDAVRGRHVVIIPDNDAPGEDHLRVFHDGAIITAGSVRLVRLPDLPLKGDVSDWLDAGGTREALLALVDEADVAEKWEWTVYDAADFLDLDIPAVQWLVDGYVREASICGNYGAPGSLKTYLGLQISLSLATGRDLFGMFPVTRSRVLIVQEDTLASDFQQAYLRPMCRELGISKDELRGWLYIAPPGEMLLDDPERFYQLEEWIKEHRPTFVMLDSFYLFHQTNGFTPEELTPILRTLKRIRNKYHCTIWLLDHDRKTNKSANGSENPIDRWMGGRPKSAACEMAIESVPGENGTATIYVRKLRGGAPPKPLTIRLVNGVLVADDPEEIELQQRAMMLHKWLLKEGGSRTMQQMEKCGLKSTALHQAMGELQRAGLVRHTGNLGRAKQWIGLKTPDPTIQAPDLEAFFDD